MPLPITRIEAVAITPKLTVPFATLLLGFTLVQVILAYAWWQLLHLAYPPLFQGVNLALPSGLIIAIVLGMKPALWLSAPLAQLIFSLLSGTHWVDSLALTLGISVEVLLTYGLLRLFNTKPNLIRLRDLCLLLGTLLLFTQTLSSSYQSLILLALTLSPSSDMPQLWLRLWSVGAIEKLVITPLILSLLYIPIKPDGRLSEFIACATLLVTASFYALSAPESSLHPSLFILFPLLSFIALRQSLTLTCVSLLLLCLSGLSAVRLLGTTVNDYYASSLSWLLLAAILSALLVCVHHRSNRLRHIQFIKTATQYDKLFNNAPVLINGFNDQGQCIVWNKECEAVYKWSRAEMLQHADPLSLLYPDAKQRQRIERDLKSQNENTFQEWHPVNRDGETLTVLWGTVRIDAHTIVGIGVNLTERVHAESEVRHIKERYDSLVRRIPAGVFTLRQTTQGQINYEYVSPRLCEIYGLSAADIYQNPDSIGNRWHPDDRAEVIRIAAETRPWLTPMQVDARLTVNGEERWLRIDANPIRLPNGDTLYDGTQTDITAIKEAEFELSIAASVFQRSYDSIFILDAALAIVDANPSAVRLSGYERPHLLNSPINQLFPNDGHPNISHEAIWQTIQDTGVWQGQVELITANQSRYPLQLSIVPIQNSKAVTQRYIMVGTDVSAFKAREAHLEKLAHFDPLTLLPNRHLLADRLNQAMRSSSRHHKTLAVCYIDLDGFKTVNDQHGHDAGDALLQHVASRLLNELRKTDTIARIGGDELILLLNDLNHPNEAKPLLERVLHSIALPYIYTASITLRVSASIGASFYPHQSQSPEQLVQLADQAMYQAKQSGKNTYRFYALHDNA